MPALWLSLWCGLVAVLLSVLPAAALAWVLARRRFAGRALVEVAVLLPVVVPPVVTGYALLVLLGRQGWVGRWMEAAGASVVFTWVGAALAQAVVAAPLLVLTLRAAFASVDRDLEEAALTAGASRWRAFMSVTLPLAWPGVVAGCVLAFARAVGEFGATIIVAGNIEGRTRTLPLAIYTATQTPGAQRDALVLSLAAVALAAAAVALHRALGARFVAH